MRRCMLRYGSGVTSSGAGSVPLHRAAKLNSPKRYIGSYEFQNDSRRATAPALISTLDRSAVDRNEQNAKKKRTERTKKNTAMMKDEFSTIRMDY